MSVLGEVKRMEPNVEILFAGRRNGIERDAAQRNSIPYRAVTTAPWPTRLSPTVATSAVCNLSGILQSMCILRSFRPDIVFTTGGYVSLPMAIAAGLARYPLVIHEQNRLPGRATRLAARFAAHIALGTEDVPAGFASTRTVYAGTPVRSDILGDRPAPESARDRFGLDRARFTVLALGGSQGARSINRAVAGALEQMDPQQVQVILSTGERDFEETEHVCRGSDVRTTVRPFIEDMSSAYAAADLAVCRSGASTLAELAIIGLPAILVPYPHAAGGHQLENAERFVSTGAAKLILDSELSSETLAETIVHMAEDTTARSEMARAASTLARPDATHQIARLLIDTAAG
jgi:UDP-N-acetylglucosamine--N-acetylmuramyl-(pentapeptide) pyrophosphoryl-undecaprenol N-acetylglucosamine transferase